MGIYDRDYYRQEQPGGLSLSGPRTIVGTLVLINVVVYVADWLLTDGRISQTLAATLWTPVNPGTLRQPWMWWQLLTYGFVHAAKPSHVAFNMLGLWILGRDIESAYGRKEFLRLYLVLLVVGSLAWTVSSEIIGPSQALVEAVKVHPDLQPRLIGASGAVVGIVILYALNFPRRTLLLFFVLPVPAWVAGLLLVLIDLHGAVNRPDSNVAYAVHLAGAAFAFLYYQFGWNFTRWTTGWSPSAWLKGPPRLRIHHPDREESGHRDLNEEVDRILEKIHRQGEASLTRKERRTLENASRQYQKKRGDADDSDQPG